MSGEDCHDSRKCCLRMEKKCKGLKYTYPDGKRPFRKLHITDIAGQGINQGRDDGKW